MVNECVILADDPGALSQLCGISTLERLLRTLQRCGITQATILSSTPDPIARELARPSWARAHLKVTLRARPSGAPTTEQISDAWPATTQLLPIIPADSVFDPRLLRTLLSQQSPAALVDSGVRRPSLQALIGSAPDTARGKLCGPALLTREWASAQGGPLEQVLRNGLANRSLPALDVSAQPQYYVSMRRHLRPYWFPAPSPNGKNRELAKRVLFDSAQKGTLDIPALCHAPIETFLVSRLCKTGITPNQLTLLCNIVAWVVTLLLATGHLGWGLGLALVVGVLDGLDGKQARIKIETTKSGKIEHWFDALFEMSWWIAIAWHFRISGQLPTAFDYLLLLLAAEGVDGLAKGSVYFTTGQVIDELGRFERFVRLVGGRRNVYVWILTIGFLLGTPAKAFIFMAWLQVATAIAHLPSAVGNFIRNGHLFSIRLRD
ncbi:MAG TPA: CDP-alcohol phosphatidyltransferase family protein [Candidatus Binatia bacterium]|nr:CDP-alcohol phosphatidyltransferase family protein [Candidatus Binatia bacterium]